MSFSLRPVLRGPRAVLLSLATLLCLVLLGAGVMLVADSGRAEGPANRGAPRVADIRTDSPRDTFASFLRLKGELEEAARAYLEKPSFRGSARLGLLSDQMSALIDLDQVPSATRRDTGIRTYVYLMDIFGRIPVPDPATMPDADAFEAENDASYRIPGTPIRIIEINDGAREGEFLFAPSTVQVAPRFFRAVQDQPLRGPLEVDSYTDFLPQMTGPMIPGWLVRAIPPAFTTLWLETPVWKAVPLIGLIVLAMFLLGRLQRVLSAHAPSGRIPALIVQAILPGAVVAAALLVIPEAASQLRISGRFAMLVQMVETVAAYLAYGWLFWIAVRLLFEWILRAPHIKEESFDANLLRLVSGIIGIIGVAVILAFGGQAIGLPILSVLAGLGIGGLAVALALRPTLENFVGGVMLYVDRPVRVGDLCTFGEHMGNVEAIGIRSTKIRSVDRSIIAVPNAQFADMQIINWTRCDSMMILENLNLRPETTPDQLRFVLAEMRRLAHAHPRVIQDDTIRIRFIGPGERGPRLLMRVYVNTREWNDFFAIREDILLRVIEIARDAGTGMSLASHTVYMARDPGVDSDRGRSAAESVDDWRRSGRLPFPALSEDERAILRNSLDYPPAGSPHARAAAEDRRG